MTGGMSGLRLGMLAGAALALAACYLEAGGVSLWASAATAERSVIVTAVCVLAAITHLPSWMTPATRVPPPAWSAGLAIAACAAAAAAARPIVTASADGLVAPLLAGAGLAVWVGAALMELAPKVRSVSPPA